MKLAADESWSLFGRQFLWGALALLSLITIVEASAGIVEYDTSASIFVAGVASLVGLLCAQWDERYFSSQAAYRVYGAVWGFLLSVLVVTRFDPGATRDWGVIASHFLPFFCLAPLAVLLIRAGVMMIAKAFGTGKRLVCASLIAAARAGS